MTTLTLARAPVARELQRFFWLHPEWWTVGLCGFAWAAVLFNGWPHAGAVRHWMTFPQELAYWLLMVAAMMLPLVIPTVRVTAAGSLWARRHRAIAGYLAGYFAPWLALGIAAAALRQMSWTHTYAVAALGFALAALWQRMPIHTRALVACHRRRPLAPVGWRADRDCLRFGAAIGRACVLSCWPLMLACTFAGHDLIAITGSMAVGAAERWYFRPRKLAMLVGALALAGYYVVLACLDPGLRLASQQLLLP